MHAEVESIVVSGPARGKHQTYVLLDDRVPAGPPPPDPEHERAELLRRWFTGHGPATAADAAWWTGLPVGAVREALATLPGGALAEAEDDAGERWYARAEPAPSAETPAGVRLLGTFDESTVGYRGLRGVVDGRPTTELLPLPVTSDAEVVGSWRRAVGPKEDVVDVRLDRPLGARQHAQLRAEAERHAAFHGRTLRLGVSPGPG